MSVIKPALHHVTIKTSRLQEMVDWYRILVGVEVIFQDANNAWTSNDGANHRIAFLSVPGLEADADKAKHTGMHHSAFEYGSFDDLISSYERLSGEGILPAFSLDHGLTISIYYRDPEGNFVELQSDNFGNWKQSTEFMKTSKDFQSNPIGTFFDPEKVLQAHKAGEAFATLQPAIRAGKYQPDTVPPMGLPTDGPPGAPVHLGS
jgi:catechol 2,3-dioxygenase